MICDFCLTYTVILKNTLLWRMSLRYAEREQYNEPLWTHHPGPSGQTYPPVTSTPPVLPGNKSRTPRQAIPFPDGWCLQVVLPYGWVLIYWVTSYLGTLQLFLGFHSYSQNIFIHNCVCVSLTFAKFLSLEMELPGHMVFWSLFSFKHIRAITRWLFWWEI